MNSATTETFQSDVLDSETPVLVKFWAPWCTSCVAMEPILEEFAEDNAGRIKVVNVNVMDEQDLITPFGIRSLPALKLFVGGDEVHTSIGPRTKQQLEDIFLGLL